MNEADLFPIQGALSPLRGVLMIKGVHPDVVAQLGEVEMVLFCIEYVIRNIDDAYSFLLGGNDER